MSCRISFNQHSLRVTLGIFLFLMLLPLKATETKYGVAVLNHNNELVFSYDVDSKIKNIENLAKTDHRIHVWRAKSTKNNGTTYFYFEDLCPWQDYASQIKRVVINDNFSTTLWIQLTFWFADMTSLTEIEGIEYLNTSGTSLMLYMFKDCKSLKTLDLSTFDTSKCTDFAFMFQGCENLEEVKVSSFNTTNATDMRCMFERCKKLKSLDLCSFDTGKVTNMSNMFYGCESLTELNLSSFNTSNVTNMRMMFSNCQNLASLDVHTFSTEKVTDMSYMFNACYKLTTLDLGGFTTKSLETADFMFYLCMNLETIYNGWTWTCSKSADTMFAQCLSLKGAIAFDQTKSGISYANPETGYFTMGIPCALLQSNGTLYFSFLPSTYIRAYSQGSYPFWYGDVITNYDFASDRWDVKNGDIKKVVIEERFKYAHPKHLRNFFYGLKNVTEISGLEYINTSGVTDMGQMFSGCSSLQSLNLDGFNTSDATDMSSLFNGCTNLSALKFPKSFDTSKVTDMSNMFFNCSSLTELHLDSLDTKKVEWMNGMFNGCTNLKTIYCDNTWTASYSSLMFFNCTSLQGARKYDSEKTDVSMANPQCYFTATKIQEYDLSICGVNVNNVNCHDLTSIPGVTVADGGHAYYDNNTKTLYLKGASIHTVVDNQPALVNKISGLTIYLEKGGKDGKSSILSERGIGMDLIEPTTIKSSDSSELVVTSMNTLFDPNYQWLQGAMYDVALRVRSTLSVESANMTVMGKYGICGVPDEGKGRMTMKGNSVIAAQGTNGSVTLMHNVTGDNVRIIQPEGAKNENGDVRLDGKTVTAWVFIVSSSESANPYDVNQDGKVDISDIVAVINTIAGDNTYKSTSDTNGDKKTDISDIVAIINAIAAGD